MQLRALGWLVRGMIWMGGIGLLVVLLASNVTRQMDDAIYDTHLHYWGYTPQSDVVIIAIDPKSLDALGRWPWPRSTHAALLDRLHAARVRGIGMDVIISSDDAGHSDEDELLAQSVKRAGNVVMPVFAESVDLGGQLQENLPIPAIVQSAAGIGHVDVGKDADETVRGAYLKAGLGEPAWPSLALAMQQIGHPDLSAKLPGMRDATAEDDSPYL